jgi:hypothetical protein
MTSLSEIAANTASAIIVRSDNILADLQNLNINNEAVYALMNGTTTWLIRMDNDGSSSSIFDDVSMACIRAKTREDAIRIFVDIAPSWVIISHISSYNDPVIKNISDERIKILNSEEGQTNNKYRTTKFDELLSANRIYIVNYLIGTANNNGWCCEELKFNKVY